MSDFDFLTSTTDQPRLAIKPTKGEPRCTDLQGVSWPTTPPIPLPSGAEAVIAVVLPQHGRCCAACANLDRVGLLRRVPAIGALRPDRVVLTCRCTARFVRMDGGL
jgi:hypothetical protein